VTFGFAISVSVIIGFATTFQGALSMAAMRFLLLGGFLGAGKTTAIARLARHYREQGLRVGIVTNDQAADLVDTESLRAQGFDVGEVAGACFCCKFPDLAATVEKLGSDFRPDVILAEPVGSCTDLVATVVRPLTQFYRTPLEVAPYGVLLKPSHGGRILRNQPHSGFSPKAAYIFRKQLEEADFLVLNRIDELSQEEANELAGLLADQFPGRPVLRVSARTGEGFPALFALLEQRGPSGQRTMDVDYDVYAEGEAELGWLNGQVRVSRALPFALDEVLLKVIGRLRDELGAQGAETAHLKVIGQGEATYGVANLVSSFTEPELSLPSQSQVADVELTVNARVGLDPQQLETLVRKVLTETAAGLHATVAFGTFSSFRPGRPVPTHRILSST